MNILGLDMSTVKTGFSYFINGELKDYGVWKVDSKIYTDWRDRIKVMASCIDLYIKEHKVEKIYVEDVPPTLENTQTVKVLSALQGVLISLTIAYNIEVIFVPVKTWKTQLGINLVSSKENYAMKSKVKTELGSKALSKLKALTKAYEKKMSIEWANHIYGTELVYKSPTSKFNDDDIADSINIVYSQTITPLCKYNIERFSDIMQHFYDIITDGEK